MMNYKLSGDEFINILTILTLIGALLVLIIFYIANRRGVDVTKKDFGLKVAIPLTCIFIVVPLLISDLDVLWKLIISIASLAAGLANYFAVGRMQDFLRKNFFNNK